MNKRLIAAGLIAALFVGLAPPLPAAGSDSDEIDRINRQLAELDQRRAAINADINEVRSTKDSELAEQEAVSRRMDVTQNELALLMERLGILEADMAEKEEGVEALQLDIEAKQESFDEQYSAYLSRLRSMQLTPEASQLSALLGAASFADYLATNDMMGRMQAYDTRLMERIRGERAALEEARTGLEEELEAVALVHAQVREEQAAVEGKRDELAREQSAIQSRLHDIDEMERQFKAELEKNTAQQSQMKAQLDAVYARIALSENPYEGGEMQWPVPGYSQISSYYGWRFGGADFHTGVDIFGGGILGQNVVAANGGTVCAVNWNYVPGKDYGIYVMVDHGGGVTSLYAHLSNITVSMGQRVERGEVIANVGNTGWSTGPHLHFEIRVNKKHTDPMPYLKG